MNIGWGKINVKIAFLAGNPKTIKNKYGKAFRNDLLT